MRYVLFFKCYVHVITHKNIITTVRILQQNMLTIYPQIHQAVFSF